MLFNKIKNWKWILVESIISTLAFFISGQDSEDRHLYRFIRRKKGSAHRQLCALSYSDQMKCVNILVRPTPEKWGLCFVVLQVTGCLYWNKCMYHYFNLYIGFFFLIYNVLYICHNLSLSSKLFPKSIYLSESTWHQHVFLWEIVVL